MSTISQRELRNDSGEVLRRVEAGESFTVTRRGVPVAVLVPHRDIGAGGPERFVPADRLVHGLRDVPDWGVDAFEAEQRELDNRVDDEPRDVWPAR